jgi:type II secretory pathway pseudopilin PulG
VSRVDAGDEGYTMVALLVVVLILGVMSALVLGGGFATPQPVVTATKGHVAAACESDYDSVSQAVQSYFASNLAYPPAGSSWATSDARGGPYLQSWPADPEYYGIDWNGQNVSVVPVHGHWSSGSFGSKTPSTGCFAT